MFAEFIRQKMIEAATQWGVLINSEAESRYLGAARDWAINKARGANEPPPVIPNVVIFEVTQENGIKVVETEIPVSKVKPESFLPTYGTDINSFGGPVGGPIPGQENLFYATSGANPQAGEVYAPPGAVFVYQRPTPFGGFWRKIA